MSELVGRLEQLLHDQPKNPLRPHQVEVFQDEMQRLEAVATAPAYVTGADRGLAAKRRRDLKTLMDKQLPKKIAEAKREDDVLRVSKEVLEKEIIPALLPRSVMRRNPAGAVDRFLTGENSPKVKRAILAYKRAILALNHDNRTEQSLASIEKYRPEGEGPNGTASFMPGAQIPGHFAMSQQAKDNWPLGPPTIETAHQQAARMNQEEKFVGAMRRQMQMPEAERKAWGQKMAAARKAKAEARKKDIHG